MMMMMMMMRMLVMNYSDLNLQALWYQHDHLQCHNDNHPPLCHHYHHYDHCRFQLCSPEQPTIAGRLSTSSSFSFSASTPKVDSLVLIIIVIIITILFCDADSIAKTWEETQLPVAVFFIKPFNTIKKHWTTHLHCHHHHHCHHCHHHHHHPYDWWWSESHLKSTSCSRSAESFSSTHLSATIPSCRACNASFKIFLLLQIWRYMQVGSFSSF